eukprot:TRINITY_DN10930_c0_g1_i1.p1 TRINITY_DN10930_c0_g1~~TRINITY_DN10930_c0_g1_i1.p1  ORF type:complete len:541 (-),score=152.66 TRINITY_DN10930_c0_g1_i1:47-1642(-)
MAAPPDHLQTAVLLHISCMNLHNLDALSKSDPEVITEVKQPNGSWSLVGKTEKIINNLNPTFSTPISIAYYFEQVQNLRFRVLDVDHDGATESEQDYIGSAESTLGNIVGSKYHEVSLTLTKPGAHSHANDRGRIVIKAEEVPQLRQSVVFKMSGSKLDKKDFFGKSDPYVVISKLRGQEWTKIHQTEVVMKTLDPTWNSFEIPLGQLNGGNMNGQLRFECYDWDSDGKHDFIGSIDTTLSQIIEHPHMDLLNAKKKKGKEASGTLHIHTEMVQTYGFLDYIFGGCQISLIVAIDFTLSNREPREPNSLHFRSQNLNDYQKAIISIGNILEYYDYDKKFPVYGFGGQLPDGTTSHCFALNGNPGNPEVAYVQGILDVYNLALDNIKLSGPTNFSELIHNCSQYSRSASQAAQIYTVLLIITDGEITDMDRTIDEIVSASDDPLSIIICGVGKADFTNMNRLDCDGQLLRSGMRTAKRDIVQFVPFREYNGDTAKLAADTLAEVPAQLVGWMKSRKIAPLVRPVPPPVLGST